MDVEVGKLGMVVQGVPQSVSGAEFYRVIMGQFWGKYRVIIIG